MDTANDADFLPLLSELIGAYQAFNNYDAAGYSEESLTAPQAHVIFALGNTLGLSFKEIGEKTLITKGTLTGIIDRLENKNLVKRIRHISDKRSTLVSLTPKGASLYEREFPRRLAWLKKKFDHMNDSEIIAATAALKKLRTIFQPSR